MYVKADGEEFYKNVEFEGFSSNFKRHHPKERWRECELIICTLHDWKESPLPVLEVHPDGSGGFFKPGETEGSFYSLKRLVEKKPL